MAGATIEFDGRVVLDAIHRAAAVLDDPARLLQNMGEYLMIVHRKRFLLDRSAPDGTPWQALSPAYLRRKKKNQHRILYLRGDLADYLHYQVTDGALEFGTSVKYGAIHHFGGEIQMPAKAQELYFRRGRDGTVGNRFVKRSRSNFAQTVSRGPYTIRIPARPWLGTSDTDDEALLDIVRQQVERALAGSAA